MPKTYRTIQGDFWDSISLKTYGSEHYMHELIQANYKYNTIAIFPANIELIVPEIVSENKIVFPKWRIKK